MTALPRSGSRRPPGRRPGGRRLAGPGRASAAASNAPGGVPVIRVLLVDDQELIRTGLRGIPRARFGFEIVGECAGGRGVGAAVAKPNPDVQRGHHQDTREPHLRQAAATRPRRCDRLRLRPRAGRPVATPAAETRVRTSLPSGEGRTEVSPARKYHPHGNITRTEISPARKYQLPGRCSRQRLVIGRRRSRPKFFGVIFGPGGYCRRLYSAASTILITRSTRSRSYPAATSSSAPRSLTT